MKKKTRPPSAELLDLLNKVSRILRRDPELGFLTDLEDKKC